MKQQRPPDLKALFAKPDLTLADTRGDNIPSYSAICACGEEDGAANYAWHHNRSGDDDTPVLIEFRATFQDTAIDGRDFLYTAFQFGRPELAKDVLSRLFGPQVIRYAKRAWSKKDSEYKIAMCDLAIFDPEIIAAHHANRSVIAGRYGTLFRSAFTVRMPIEPAAIARVWTPETEPIRAMAQISLDNIR